MRFIDVWNKIFQIKGMASAECLTETQFIDLVSQSLMSNVDNIDRPKNSNQKVRNMMLNPVQKALSPERMSA